jgi:hypothetical protein
MGSDSKSFQDAAAAVASSASRSVELSGDGADMLAFIGYEAADPSLFSPQWRETLQSLPSKRESR